MTLPPLPDERAEDLFWHALNYRTAATQHAEAMWQELQACVDRKVQAAVLAEREACAKACDQWTGRNDISGGALLAIRARGET